MRECGQAVPRKVPTGRVLAHNHVRHAVDMPNGYNGEGRGGMRSGT
jgi:hypothetical protein